MTELRRLPSVDKLLSDARVRKLAEMWPQEFLVDVVREELDSARAAIMGGSLAPTVDALVSTVVERAGAMARPRLRRLINATGVILHTNLGRAPLSSDAIAAMETIARGYSNLEYDIESGKRGSRHAHVEELLCRLSGAEAALAVNNNAAGLLLALSALAKDKEAIVSRGQAVEIGGGFRIPDVMRQSGVRLVEVGTTNRTYLRDYQAAITPATALLLRVHSSNFKVVGFTHSVELAEMVALGTGHGLVVMDDLGSGCLLPTDAYGLDREPLVQESVTAGADVISFSGDKLLGGPQAGLIVGKKAIIDQLKRHPLARALRLDKVTLAALSATLMHYLRGEALEKIPVWQMIAQPLGTIELRVEAWAAALGDKARVVGGESAVGGGSLPGATLPTRLLAISGEAGSPVAIAARLRRHDPPVIARVEHDSVLLDPRTVLSEEDGTVLSALRWALRPE